MQKHSFTYNEKIKNMDENQAKIYENKCIVKAQSYCRKYLSKKMGKEKNNIIFC